MRELNVGGIYFAPIAGDLVLAFVIYYIVQRLLRRVELERRVWHPPLFNLCLFVIILCLLTLLE